MGQSDKSGLAPTKCRQTTHLAYEVPEVGPFLQQRFGVLPVLARVLLHLELEMCRDVFQAIRRVAAGSPAQRRLCKVKLNRWKGVGAGGLQEEKKKK